MSVNYPPSGGRPPQSCQRCGMSLPPNETRCGNCGFTNMPGPGGNFPGGSSSNMPPSQAGFGPGQPGQFNSGAWGPASGAQLGRPAGPPTASGLFTPLSIPQAMTPGPVPVTPGPVPTMPGPGPISQMNNDPFGGPVAIPINRGASPTTGRRDLFQNRSVSKVRVFMGVIVLIVMIASGSIFALTYVNKQTAPPKPTVVAIPTPKVAATYTDPFVDNSYGWNLASEPGKYVVQIGGGNLTLEDDDHKLLWEQLPGQHSFSDFTLYVDATLTKGDALNGYGIYIRGASNANSDLATYYRFELYGEGAYGIYKGIVSDNGESGYTKLVDYTLNNAINKAGKVNKIRITAQGSTLTFMVNGHLLQTLTDTSYSKGTVAFFVSNTTDAKAGAQAQFANFGIYPVDA